MVEIAAGLLLGNEADAEAVAEGKKVTTKRLTVTHVLSITNKPPDWLNPDQSATAAHTDSAERCCGDVEGCRTARLATMFVEAADLPDADLLHQFEQCCGFIQQGVEQGNILVHWYISVYGISRSATVVLAYLMWKEGRPLQVLFREVQSKKPDIRPNAGFMEQLKLWGSMKCHVDVTNKSYKLYRLKHMAHSMDFTDFKCVGEIKSAMSADPTLETQDSTAYYKCRKCRRLLFTEDSVLQHEVGKGFDWHKRSKGQSVGVATSSSSEPEDSGKGQRSGSPTLCSSYFIEPVEWMEELLLGNVDGKVLCPKCKARLGSFSWAGHQCSCGQWVNPSFQIHKVKVDEIRTLTKRKLNITQKT